MTGDFGSQYGLSPTRTRFAGSYFVCRLIHKEAAPVLYDENEFCTHVEPYRFGKEVVAHAGAVYVPLIRKLRFVSSGFWFRRRAYRVPEMLNSITRVTGHHNRKNKDIKKLI
jgi:hypothetical protein